MEWSGSGTSTISSYWWGILSRFNIILPFSSTPFRECSNIFVYSSILLHIINRTNAYTDPPLSFVVTVFDDFLFNDASNGFCRLLVLRTEDFLIIFAKCEVVRKEFAGISPSQAHSEIIGKWGYRIPRTIIITIERSLSNGRWWFGVHSSAI